MNAQSRTFTDTLFAYLEQNYHEFVNLRDGRSRVIQEIAQVRREISRILEELNAEIRLDYAP